MVSRHWAAPPAERSSNIYRGLDGVLRSRDITLLTKVCFVVEAENTVVVPMGEWESNVSFMQEE